MECLRFLPKSIKLIHFLNFKACKNVHHLFFIGNCNLLNLYLTKQHTIWSSKMQFVLSNIFANPVIHWTVHRAGSPGRITRSRSPGQSVVTSPEGIASIGFVTIWNFEFREKRYRCTGFIRNVSIRHRSIRFSVCSEIHFKQ